MSNKKFKSNVKRVSYKDSIRKIRQYAHEKSQALPYNCDSKTITCIGTLDRSVKQAIAVLVVPGLKIGLCIISKDDELLLLPDEKASIPFTSLERCRASGAGRYLAHQLMKSMGFVDIPITRSALGYPLWPPGVVGSIAHNDQIAVATTGMQNSFHSVGIDIETAEPLPPDMLELICTSEEKHAILDYPFGTKLLFVIKEAVYKTTFPLDHTFLDFHDIIVDLASQFAITSTGYKVKLHWCISSHIVAVATIQKTP